jgi:hypothetical protein
MSITSNFRKHLKAFPEIAKFVMPSTKYEVLLDLNGDGKCDFAFIDTTGDGTPDSFALDRTGSGELNLYFVDTDGNGLAETIFYYPDGQDTPSYTKIAKDNEAGLYEFLGRRLRECMTTALKENDPQRIMDTLYGIKNDINERAKVYGKIGNLAGMRLKMKADPEMAKMLCPSPKNELFFDVNGDGVADFALIDTNHSGNLDTIAMDLTGTGEFNLYLSDLDDTGAPEKVVYYLDEDNEPMAAGAGSRHEAVLRPAAMKFMITLRSEFTADSLKKAMCAYRDDAVAALKALAAEVQAENA